MVCPDANFLRRSLNMPTCNDTYLLMRALSVIKWHTYDEVRLNER
jgi:hypothetical protein